jgi:hypothetical protein
MIESNDFSYDLFCILSSTLCISHLFIISNLHHLCGNWISLDTNLIQLRCPGVINLLELESKPQYVALASASLCRNLDFSGHKFDAARFQTNAIISSCN